MRDQAYLEHIRDAIDRILDYTDDMSREDFAADQKTQDAVVRQFEVMGEAAKQLSDRTRDRLTSVPWQDIAGMRDRLIHGYFDVDNDVVWATVQQDLPELRNRIGQFLEDE
ncbi:MAG: DUF86 domain-containing protein [Candidatus Nanohaloarchaea archaeon]|nr:DUF86 domain-containing protein [Candidatus Nanohaloarchaea archaeon]